MELIQTKAAGKRLSTSSQGVKIPFQFSRGKALQYIKNRSEGSELQGAADDETVNRLYEMYLKIGATNELPEKQDHIVGYLSDFWRTVYLNNNLVPDDIPFDVVMDEFTGKMVRGEVNRKGNNQAAICQAFNRWVTQTDTRNRLYYLRDKKYPNDKPKQLESSSGYAHTQDEAEANHLIRGKKVHEWSDDVILSQYKKITGIFSGEDGKKALEGFGVAAYSHKIITEAQKRNLV